MRVTNSAPATNAGGSVDAGFRRFLLVGATNEDPKSQTDTLTESDDYTEWTSNGTVTLGSGGSNPQNGSVYIRALTDANGDAVTWDKPFTVTVRLERISPVSGQGSVKNNLMYWGFGITDSASSIDAANMIGQDTRWNSSSSTGGRHYRFRKDSKDNAQNTTTGWDPIFRIMNGPKKNSQASHLSLSTHIFDPAAPLSNAHNAMNTYNVGSARVTGTGDVYAFATVGLADAVTSSPRSGKFRIWYHVNATDLDWDIS